jgi:hypothetical protein
MLYKLLERRGDILETHGAGAFVVRCPRRARHSCGRDGDGSTLLFAPQGSGYGVLHCKHDSCADVSFSEWLAALDVNTGAPPANRIARIEGVGIDSGAAFGVRLVLTLAPADGRPLPMRYLRIYSSSPTRWEALWTATNVEAPDDLNPKGDLGAAAHELRGRRIKLELDTVAGDEVVRALHAPDPQ